MKKKYSGIQWEEGKIADENMRQMHGVMNFNWVMGGSSGVCFYGTQKCQKNCLLGIRKDFMIAMFLILLLRIWSFIIYDSFHLP